MGFEKYTKQHYIDLYGISKANFDFSPEPEGVLRRIQQVGVGGDVWKENANGTKGVYQFMPIKLGGIDLWNPIIRAVGRKTIVTTPMVEVGGSVKEIISQDDYVINIKGIIKRKDGLWPDMELTELVRLYERNESVPIRSALTNVLLNGNEYVVISSIDIPDNPGFVESIAYSIECTSDIPFSLTINEEG